MGRLLMELQLTGLHSAELHSAELRPEPENIFPEVVFPEIMGAEVTGLLALMLLQESRHAARTSPTGELILLENQDRALWNREQIAEGVALLEQTLKSQQKSALRSERFSPRDGIPG